MNVLDEENISTGDSALEKFQLSSNRHSAETRGDDNMIAESTAALNFRDSRHDSPNQDEGDTTMIDSSQRSEFILRPPPIRTSSGVPPTADVTRTRVITGDNRTFDHGSKEDPVDLAPRFGSTPPSQNHHASEHDREGVDPDPSMFSISGSMSSEFLENTNEYHTERPDYHQRIDLSTNCSSPRSTTAPNFSRIDAPCPQLPSINDYSVSSFSTARPIASSRNNQRPQFYPSSATLMSTPTNTQASTSSHPTLPSEHLQASRKQSTTVLSPTIPSIGSFCENGREKPVIARCFAWSQDSQDERRITKRARFQSKVGSPATSSPLSNDTVGSIGLSMVLSPTSEMTGSMLRKHTSMVTNAKSLTLEIEEQQAQSLSQEHKYQEDERFEQRDSTLPTSSPPIKVHWEEKVEHSNELMAHASVAPQVLFASQRHEEDVSMMMASSMEEDPERHYTHPLGRSHHQLPSSPPLIDTASHSASHYSFDSV